MIFDAGKIRILLLRKGMGVFEVAQSVVSQASGVIIGDTAIDVDTLIVNMEASLMEQDVGPLFGLWFQSALMGIIALMIFCKKGRTDLMRSCSCLRKPVGE